MSADRRNLILGAAALAALLLAFIVPNFRSGAASLSHPDPVGPTVYSKSAIGHLAFRRLLEEVGIPTSISESGSGGYVGSDDVLVVAEPRTDGATLADVRAMLTVRTVLLILPKRTGTPDPNRPYWLADNKLLAEEEVARVLRLVDEKATLSRDASPAKLSGGTAFAGIPELEQPQLVHSAVLHPLLASSGGMLIGERRTSTGRIVVLSDPDLIANYALARGDNSVLAVNLVEQLRDEHPEGRIIFDEFTHGFSDRPFHLLGILFQFPFTLVTAQMALAAVLLFWAATGRFGAPVRLEAPLEAGKRSLIDNGARLLAQSGRIPELSERYFEEMARDTGRRLRAPGGLDLPAILAWLSRAAGAPPVPAKTAAPQQIWSWRKELLGESGQHTKFD